MDLARTARGHIRLASEPFVRNRSILGLFDPIGGSYVLVPCQLSS
ncbi:hypothetical protein H4W81_001845 [Nonomuraea africana]|uniref:Uncharacterized protein n=1 Tax=Nonomuraea africana TaxID=46171 RepID=A0ABR9KAM7_9ACTN|nr:hypothetical protein [Nonomuraea africana]